MKIGFIFALLVSIGAVQFSPAQAPSSPAGIRTRERVVGNDSTTSSKKVVVVTNNLPPPTRILQPTPTPQPAEPTVQGPSATATMATMPQVTAPSVQVDANNVPRASLTFAEMKGKIAEARRQLQAKPQLISSEDPKLQTSWVRIAFMDPHSRQIDFVTLSKDVYLKTNAVNQAFSSAGKSMTVRTIRANGVNSPVQVIDNNGVAQLPLMVQYPVEKNGRYVETAYYMSTHPGLVTPEVVNAGRLYVRNVVEIARDRLRQKGINILPGISDIAERLATVEHVDHDRFRNEPSQNIFNDIFTLYALNEGQTFRYSVSSAGAGGMVQMIPWTYSLIRSRYPSVGLNPNFVDGMRDHVNATQAMLLYMQMTWNDLASNGSVSGAMASGIANQKQLMAAGYNSNPAKIGGYIDRGGSNWTNLIPRETQIYLQIYDALERNVSMTPRTR